MNNLLIKMFYEAKKFDVLCLFSKHATICAVEKLFAAHLLNCNFETNHVSDMYSKHDALDITAYFPQNDDGAVKKVGSHEKNHQNEGLMDIVQAQKS